MSEFPVDFSSIGRAYKRLRGHVHRTPLEPFRALSHTAGFQIFGKLECWQKTGSFKVRGALNKLLTLSESGKKQSVVTASAGNHGLGVAFAAESVGVEAKIVVPKNASPAKKQALSRFHSQVIEFGEDYDEAEEFAQQHQAGEAVFVHAFSDPEIIAGQGTIALEILEEIPDARTILVPVGGGGLISGVGLAVKSLNRDVKVVGVQSEASPAMYTSLRAGEVVETPIEKTIADGLAGRFVTELTLRIAEEYVDEMCVVSEASIRQAMKVILETEQILVEGSAAVGVAAVLENKIATEGPAVCVLTGRNVDAKLLRDLL